MTSRASDMNITWLKINYLERGRGIYLMLLISSWAQSIMETLGCHYGWILRRFSFKACIHGVNLPHLHHDIVVTYEIRVFFEGAQKEVFSSIFLKNYKNTKAWKLAFVSSIFKYFLKSPKKRIIRVCLNRIESMSLLCIMMWYNML
jgi:hypothetical protein